MHISREVTVYYTVTGTCGRITVGTSHMDEDYDITLLYWKPNKIKQVSIQLQTMLYHGNLQSSTQSSYRHGMCFRASSVFVVSILF
jgi:hypothetical protein